jgi:hypothetical protein
MGTETRRWEQKREDGNRNEKAGIRPFVAPARKAGLESPEVRVRKIDEAL